MFWWIWWWLWEWIWIDRFVSIIWGVTLWWLLMIVCLISWYVCVFVIFRFIIIGFKTNWLAWLKFWWCSFVNMLLLIYWRGGYLVGIVCVIFLDHNSQVPYFYILFYLSFFYTTLNNSNNKIIKNFHFLLQFNFFY